jgi:Dolichyl-phosphate-mannose-protein mannosyltransferase
MPKMKTNNRINVIVLVCITGLAFGLRLYHLNSPLADWHSWRQSDTAAVARNFQKLGFDPLRPRYDDLSNIQSGLDNPNGWRMVEFPVYQVVAVGLARIFPSVPIEIHLRLVSIAASAASTLLLGLLIIELIDPFTGILTSFIFAVLPYNVYYGRTILPNIFMIFWVLLSLYALTRVGKRYPLVWMIIASSSAAVALLSRPMAIFLLFPWWYVLYRQTGLTKRFFLFAFMYLFIGGLPVYLWRVWIQQFPEGIASSEWLMNNAGIRFKGSWFYWLFAERLAALILGYWGLVAFGVGLVVRVAKKEGLFSYLWLSGILIYWIIFASGNVQHDYYQTIIVPVVALFVAKGYGLFIRKSESISRFVSIPFSIFSFCLMLAFSWYTIRTYYWINHPEIVEAGKAADVLIPKDAKVIAPYGGDTTFLYQTKRAGWPIGFEIDKKIQMGATYYVTVNPMDSETKMMVEKYTVVAQSDKYVIIDLTKKK